MGNHYSSINVSVLCLNRELLKAIAVLIMVGLSNVNGTGTVWWESFGGLKYYFISISKNFLLFTKKLKFINSTFHWKINNLLIVPESPVFSTRYRIRKLKKVLDSVAGTKFILAVFFWDPFPLIVPALSKKLTLFWILFGFSKRD